MLRALEGSQLLHDFVEIIPITVRLLPVGLGRWKRWVYFSWGNPLTVFPLRVMQTQNQFHHQTNGRWENPEAHYTGLTSCEYGQVSGLCTPFLQQKLPLYIHFNNIWDFRFSQQWTVTNCESPLYQMCSSATDKQATIASDMFWDSLVHCAGIASCLISLFD